MTNVCGIVVSTIASADFADSVCEYLLPPVFDALVNGAPLSVIVTVYAFGQWAMSIDSPCWHDTQAE